MPATALFGHGFDWQVGGFFTHESTTLTQPFQALDATDPSTILTPALGGAIIPGDYKEHSVFADITYHFNTAFDLELGGRNTDVKQNSQVNTFCCVLYGPTDTNFPAIEYVAEQYDLVGGAALAHQRGHARLCARGDGLSSRRPESSDAHLAEPALVQIGFDQELRDRDAHRPVRQDLLDRHGGVLHRLEGHPNLKHRADTRRPVSASTAIPAARPARASSGTFRGGRSRGSRSHCWARTPMRT